MDVKITAIRGQDSLDTERICFEVLKDCDLGDYILMDTTYNESGEVSNKNRHVYVFPSKKVKEGFEFEVYTRAQYESTRAARLSDLVKGGFFMGLNSMIWNKNKDTALLLKVEDSEEFKY